MSHFHFRLCPPPRFWGYVLYVLLSALEVVMIDWMSFHHKNAHPMYALSFRSNQGVSMPIERCTKGFCTCRDIFQNGNFFRSSKGPSV